MRCITCGKSHEVRPFCRVVTDEMRGMYAALEYYCPPAPVTTMGWDVDSWCRWIDGHGAWLKPVADFVYIPEGRKQAWFSHVVREAGIYIEWTRVYAEGTVRLFVDSRRLEDVKRMYEAIKDVPDFDARFELAWFLFNATREAAGDKRCCAFNVDGACPVHKS